jgi:hypothetical protein
MGSFVSGLARFLRRLVVFINIQIDDDGGVDVLAKLGLQLITCRRIR